MPRAMAMQENMRMRRRHHQGQQEEGGGAGEVAFENSEYVSFNVYLVILVVVVVVAFVVVMVVVGVVVVSVVVVVVDEVKRFVLHPFVDTWFSVAQILILHIID